MSPDEKAVLVVSLVLGTITWARWYYLALRPPEMICPVPGRWPLVVGPIAALAVLLAVLLSFSASDVRTSPTYLGFYVALGAAWLGLVVRLAPMLGLSAQRDVIERRNRAAAPPVAGAIIGLTLCFAGGNIGDGPGWWVVVLCAALATAGFFAMWLLVDLTSGISEEITIERDRAAGWRFAGLSVAWGLVLGRSVAGDWQSVDATVRDFARMAWPATLTVVAELVPAHLPRVAGMDRPRPVALLGVAPALLYVAAAAAYVVSLGWWT